MIIVTAIIAAIGVPLLLETVNAWSFNSKFQDNAVSCAVVAMNRMSRDIRRLKNDASVTTANGTTFAFTDTNNNAISYSKSGTVLMRNSDGLADNISSLTFTYYDDNGLTIGSPTVSPNTNIRRVEVDYAILAGTNTLNFNFQVRPQNLRRLSEKFK
ncbi:MAG: hypothetical protein NT088_04980 [Candidatus Omnitrophica bacterium]|nr:hypothetical protein [Candidatus Omnitrophota bacterium]